MLANCKFWTERETCEYEGGCDKQLMQMTTMMCLNTKCDDPNYLTNSKLTYSECLNELVLFCATAYLEYKQIYSKSTDFGSGGVCIFNC